MAEKWLTHRLEFLNSQGTTRFRLDKPTTGSPIILYKADANDPEVCFSPIGNIGSNFAVPVLSVLAMNAANGGDGLQKAKVYEVVWSNAELDGPIKRFGLLASNTPNRIETEIKIIRKLVGYKTVLAISGKKAYRLTVDVHKFPLGGRVSAPEIPAEEVGTDAAGSQALGENPATQITPLDPAELAAARRVTLPKSEPEPARQRFKVSALIAGVARFGWSILRASAARVTGSKLSIYVAKFGEDKLSVDTRLRVIQSIRRELSSDLVKVLFDDTHFAVGDDAVDTAARADAQTSLRMKGGDLLIYGRLYPATPDRREQVDLRFVAAYEHHARPDTFGFEKGYLLDADFAPELGTALAAVTGSLVLQVAQNAGRYAAEVLKPIADRLTPLVHNMPPKMRAVDRASLLDSYGLVQGIIGEEFDEADRIEEVVRSYRAALEAWPRDRLPLQWALTQNRLGVSLVRLCEKPSGTAYFEDAVIAFRAAADELTRIGEIELRASVNANIGVALMRFGGTNAGSDRCKEAAMILRASVSEMPRERFRFFWPTVATSLALALRGLGEGEREAKLLLEESVALLRESLQEVPRKRFPAYWVKTTIDLGAVLSMLGNFEGGERRLEEAIPVFREALRECPRYRDPLTWGYLQGHLGLAQRTLGEKKNSLSLPLEARSLLFQSWTSLSKALEECTHDRDRNAWARWQANLGVTLMRLGNEVSTVFLEEAVEAYGKALTEWTPESDPTNHAWVQYNLTKTLGMIKEIEER